MKIIFPFSIYSICLLLLLSCTTTGPVQETATGEEPPAHESRETALTPEEQQQKAFELFNEVLAVSQEDRRGNLDKVVNIYKTIMNDYPDAPLAEESYMRLFGVYLKEMRPPDTEAAINLYRVFIVRYPESIIGVKMERRLALFLYKSKDWEKLESFLTPFIRSSISTGEFESPSHMYYYAEAKFHLHQYQEARKGYKLVIKYFPESGNAKFAERRLEELEEKLQQEPQ